MKSTNTLWKKLIVIFLVNIALFFLSYVLTLSNSILGLFVVLANSLLIYLSHQKITKPIKALSDIALAIAKGQNPQIPQTKERNEIGQLYYSIRLMKESLSENIEKLERFNQFKSEFISLASHQLRTPLSAIKWLIEVIDNNNLNPSQKEKLQDIYKSNERLIELVNDLLNVAKLEGGEIVARRVIDNPVKLIQSEVDMQKLDAEMKKITVNFKVETEVRGISLDPLLFTQAFKNLLENAIAYSPEGSEVGVSIKEEGGSYVVAVHNEGAGISELEHDKLFTKFYRGPVAQRMRPSGSGLGLFIAKMAVEASGGNIWFESPTHDSGGVTFLISIPINTK